MKPSPGKNCRTTYARKGGESEKPAPVAYKGGGSDGEADITRVLVIEGNFRPTVCRGNTRSSIFVYCPDCHITGVDDGSRRSDGIFIYVTFNGRYTGDGLTHSGILDVLDGLEGPVSFHARGVGCRPIRVSQADKSESWAYTEEGLREETRSGVTEGDVVEVGMRGGPGLPHLY